MLAYDNTSLSTLKHHEGKYRKSQVNEGKKRPPILVQGMGGMLA